MKKENLALLSKGHQLIALAYAREAEVEVEAPEAEVAIETKSPVAKKPVVETPDVETNMDDASETAGYTQEELSGMTIKQLKEIASELEITVPKDTKKAEIVSLILEAQDADGEEESELEEDEGTVEAEVEVEAEVDAEGDDAESEEEGDELTAEDLDEMSLVELKELADEYEISYPKAVKSPKLREILIEELFTDEEEAPADAEDDAEGEELTAEDLEGMSLTELKELANEYEVEFPKVVKAPKLREILIAELFTEEDEEDAEDDEADAGSEETDLDEADYAEELGLNEMDVEELAEILTEHGLPTKGKKQALIARIVEAIEDGTIEIDDEEEGK